jgi:hypothetical protein
MELGKIDKLVGAAVQDRLDHEQAEVASLVERWLGRHHQFLTGAIRAGPSWLSASASAARRGCGCSTRRPCCPALPARVQPEPQLRAKSPWLRRSHSPRRGSPAPSQSISRAGAFYSPKQPAVIPRLGGWRGGRHRPELVKADARQPTNAHRWIQGTAAPSDTATVVSETVERQTFGITSVGAGTYVMMDETVLSPTIVSADSRFCHCRSFDRAGAELGVIGDYQCGRQSLPTHRPCHRGLSLRRPGKLAMALSVFLSGMAIQATQCTMAVELDVHGDVASDSIDSATKDEMCHAYMEQFIKVVAARATASSRENDAERQHSLDQLDAKISATNERLAEKCGG